MDGALLAKPQRLLEVEQALIGRTLDAATIDYAAGVLHARVEKAIGGRWSAPYKVPVFIDMFRQMLQEVMTEQKK